MSSDACENLVLCVACANFRDVDRVTSEYGFKHHCSYSALCKAAEDGCTLCQAFKQAYRSYRSRELPRNFEKEVDPSETQITWRGGSGNCVYSLSQRAIPLQNERYNVWFEVFAEGDDPLASILGGRPIQKTSTSALWIDLITYWRAKCQNEHPLCPRDEDFYLPRRVIDVGSDSRDPFLYNTQGQKGRWATLSHCWGSFVPTATTENTIQQREMSIPFKELEPTFQDAIILTRKLGLQYLWIDSLCIIQDSPMDWARESTEMDKIYSSASINISATAALSSRDGIFNSADKDRCYTKSLVELGSCSNDSNVSGSLSIRLKTGEVPMVQLEEQPLHRRAWVLQESTLSPRKIDFGSDQIYWSCRTACFSEGDPEVLNDWDWSSHRKRLFRMPLGDLPPQPDMGIDNSPISSPISWWYETLSFYWHRKLTFSEDNLPAIAGIAHEVKKRTGYNYKAGLWLEDFHRGLLWQTCCYRERLENTSVPSWSWALMKIPFDSWRLPLDIHLPGFRATVLEVNIHTLGEKLFGAIISGSLMIEGACMALENWQAGTNIIYNTSSFTMRLFHRWLDEGHHGRSRPVPPPGHVLCTLDESPVEDETAIHSRLIRRNIIVLQIAKFGHFWGSYFIKTDEEIATIYGLILEPTGRGVDEYRRVGIAEIPEENGMAEGWDRRVITVV